MTLLGLIDERDESERDWQLAIHGRERNKSATAVPAGAMSLHQFALQHGAGG